MKFTITLGDTLVTTIEHDKQGHIWLEKSLFPDSDLVYLESEDGYLWKRTITGDSPNYAEFKQV